MKRTFRCSAAGGILTLCLSVLLFTGCGESSSTAPRPEFPAYSPAPSTSEKPASSASKPSSEKPAESPAPSESEPPEEEDAPALRLEEVRSTEVTHAGEEGTLFRVRTTLENTTRKEIDLRNTWTSLGRVTLEDPVTAETADRLLAGKPAEQLIAQVRTADPSVLTQAVVAAVDAETAIVAPGEQVTVYLYFTAPVRETGWTRADLLWEDQKIAAFTPEARPSGPADSSGSEAPSSSEVPSKSEAPSASDTPSKPEEPAGPSSPAEEVTAFPMITPQSDAAKVSAQGLWMQFRVKNTTADVLDLENPEGPFLDGDTGTLREERLYQSGRVSHWVSAVVAFRDGAWRDDLSCYVVARQSSRTLAPGAETEMEICIRLPADADEPSMVRVKANWGGEQQVIFRTENFFKNEKEVSADHQARNP